LANVAGAMKRASFAAMTALMLATTGCGSVRTADQSGGQSATGGGAAGFSPYQPRDRFIECLRGNGFQVDAVGHDTAQMLPVATAPRVVFAVDGDAATALQVRGKAEGGEQVGQAFVFGARATDDQVAAAQDCM